MSCKPWLISAAGRIQQAEQYLEAVVKALGAGALIALLFWTAAAAQSCPYDRHCPDNPYGASSPFSGNGILNPFRSPPTFLNKSARHPDREPEEPVLQNPAEGGVSATPVYAAPEYAAPEYAAPSYTAPEAPAGAYTSGGYVPYGAPVGPTPQS